MNITSIEFLKEIPVFDQLVCLHDNYLFFSGKLCKFQDFNLIELMRLDFCVTSAKIDSGYLVFSTNDSVYLYDLTTHQSCHDPFHHHLESQRILYRGISPGTVLGLGRFVVLYIDLKVVVYNLEGSLIGSFFCDLPIETQVFGGYIVYRLEQKLGIVDVQDFSSQYFIEKPFKCISQGDKILLLSPGSISDLNNNTLLTGLPSAVFTLYTKQDFLLCGMPSSLILYKKYQHIHTIAMTSQVDRYLFCADWVGCLNFSVLKLNLFHINSEDTVQEELQQIEEPEDQYSDDFSEEVLQNEELIQIESSENIPIMVTPSEEINVIMNFEPQSQFLNNFGTKVKKTGKKPKNSDKPVTFHKKIKSSGYGSQPKVTKKGKNLLARKQSYLAPENPPGVSCDDFPKDSVLHNGPIFNVVYDRNGAKLATCGGDSAAYILKLPLSKFRGERIPLVGHEFQVNSIGWNSSCTHTLTTSNKYCCKLWNAAGTKPGECLLTIPGNVSDGKFYYVDKFLAAIQSNELVLYRYKLRDPFFKDDVKRLQAKCLYKESLKLKQSNSQGITRIACHNNFHSHLILSAGTNKIISVWDIDKQQEICTIPTIHRKPIHTLRFFTGSDFGDTDNESLNLFLTCSADNYIRLFDLRVATEPVLFLGHVNTALELGASISPCKQFIASGSEDKSAYIWDIKTCKPLQRLKGFKDVTNDTAWNPAFQQICVAGNEGRIKFFS